MSDLEDPTVIGELDAPPPTDRAAPPSHAAPSSRGAKDQPPSTARYTRKATPRFIATVDPVSAMLDQLAWGNYRAALNLAESVLARDPSNEDAQQCAAICKSELHRREDAGAPKVGRDEASPSQRRAAAEELTDEVSKMLERLAAGAYPAALLLAEDVLERDPSNPDAQQCVSICRSELRATYVRRLGSLQHVPCLATPRAAVKGLGLDPIHEFVVGRIDDKKTLDQLLGVVGLPALDALRALFELTLEGVIEMQHPR